MQIHSAALLPLAYFAPMQWYTKLLLHETIALDFFENYVKQTWRNRCRIGGANGIQDLSIPVTLLHPKTPMFDVQIDHHERWQQQHWRSIQAAYGQSAFFEYYADYFSPFYFQPAPRLLVEFTLPLLDKTLQLLKLDIPYLITDTYISASSTTTDYRKLISPKINLEADLAFQAYTYPQVFTARFGFRANLSILDLLCCCGPQGADILKYSIA